MSRIGGIRGYVLLDPNTTTPTFGTEWLGIKTWNLGLTAEIPDTSSFDDDGWRSFVAGLKSFTASIQAFWDTDLASLYKGAETAPDIFIGESLAIRLVLCEVGDPAQPLYFQFVGHVKQMTPKVDVAGAVEYSLECQGEGQVTFQLEAV